MRPLFLLLALAGCEEPEPFLQVGTGERDFEPLEDGDDILIIQGPQGGFHVLGSFIAAGIEAGDTNNLFDENNPTMHFTVREDGERVDASNPFIQGLDEGPGRNEFQVNGRFVFLDIEADDELVGSTLVLSIDLEDVNGVTLHDEVTLNGVASPFNE